MEAVAAETAGSLTIEAVAVRGELDLAISASADEGWADRAVSMLDAHGAQRTAEGVRVRVRRTALSPMADV